MAHTATKAEPSTVEAIVDLIRRPGAGLGLAISREAAIALVEEYAAVVAGEASIKAVTDAHDRALIAFDAAASKPLIIKACHAPIEGTKNLCTRDAGHPGEHRCLAVDVDNRRKRSLASPDLGGQS